MAAVHPLAAGTPRPPLAFAYEWSRGGTGGSPPAPNVLARIFFGTDHRLDGDPRDVGVPLRQLPSDGLRAVETWTVDGDVRHGSEDDLCWSSGGDHLMLALRADEAAHGGVHRTAAHVYRRLRQALAAHDSPYLLRIWNYLADINAGDGDNERYRQFTTGRAEGLAGLAPDVFPAATAIGRTDGRREIVVYALAAARAGQPVENPRQVSAYRYPRQYGPVPPSFARAMRIDGHAPSLLISGTASVVGHASMHDCPAAQVDETLRNLASLTAAGGLGSDGLDRALLKAYVRHPADAVLVLDALVRAGVDPRRLVCLHGDICRTELLVEIDGVAYPA